MWREHPDQLLAQQQRRRFPFDAREEERGYRRPRSGSGGLEEERDSLPEWCLEDAEEETGTFDSSGAFLSLKVTVSLLGCVSDELMPVVGYEHSLSWKSHPKGKVVGYCRAEQ